jgi:hypothetical protein
MDKFEKLVWEKFKDSDSVDQLVYELKQIRKHMLKHKSFARLLIVEQINLCVTIGCIVTHTVTAEVSNFSIINKEGRGDRKYDIRNGYKKPEYLDIKEKKQKLLPEKIN